MRNSIAALSPGIKVKVDFLRDGKNRTVTVTIGERNKINMDKLSKASVDKKTDAESMTHRKIGITVTNINERTAKKYGISASKKGIIIVGIDQSFTDARATLKEGDIIKEIQDKRRRNE